jgi:hypothetical protein
VFYSDSSTPKVCDVDSTAWGVHKGPEREKLPAVQCQFLSAKPLDEENKDKSAPRFLTADNEWLQTVMEVRLSKKFLHDLAESDLFQSLCIFTAAAFLVLCLELMPLSTKMP